MTLSGAPFTMRDALATDLGDDRGAPTLEIEGISSTLRYALISGRPCARIAASSGLWIPVSNALFTVARRSDTLRGLPQGI